MSPGCRPPRRAPATPIPLTTTAPAVQRLLDAGALLIGKTNLDQFATGLVGTRSPYGVPRNVFDASYVPGGSSSGSACAVAAGIVPFALGTDTAGSGRVPAAFGNIVGLKPTLGSVSARGVVPACRSLDTISVFARSVDEALAVQRVIAGYDADGPLFARCTVRSSASLARRMAIRRAHRHVATADTGATSRCSWKLPACSTTVHGSPNALLHCARWWRCRPDILHPVTRTILEGGLTRRTVDAFDAFHRLAEARRSGGRTVRPLRRAAAADRAVLPDARRGRGRSDRCEQPARHVHQFRQSLRSGRDCGAAGFDSKGMPIGVMLIGPAWSEGRLGRARGWHASRGDSIASAQPGMSLPPAAAAGCACRRTRPLCSASARTCPVCR